MTQLNAKEQIVCELGRRLFSLPTSDAELRTMHAQITKLRDTGFLSAQNIADAMCDGIFEACIDHLRTPIDRDVIGKLGALTSPTLMDTSAADTPKKPKGNGNGKRKK